jgi:two-component system, chemotaxis family, response regulator Rcp1
MYNNSTEILLAEDEDGDIFIVKKILQNSKLRNNLSIVKNGADALAYLRKKENYSEVKTPDIMLLDINMPGKNGHEVLTEMKNDHKLKSIPVIIMTSSDTEDDIARSYNNHANCYIRKPTNFFEFEKVVTSIESFWLSIVTLPPRR